MSAFRRPTLDDEEGDDERFRARFPRVNGEQFDSSNHGMSQLLDNTMYPSTNIDVLVRLPTNVRPPMIHTTYHGPRGGQNTQFPSVGNRVRKNENYRFCKNEYIGTLLHIRGVDWNYLVTHYGQRLQYMGYGAGGTLEDALNEYLDQCNGMPCLIGAAFLRNRLLDHTNQDNAHGPPLSYSPHVTPQKAQKPRAYISGSLTKCLRRFRTKDGWEQYYGWGRQYGDRATVCIIDQIFWPLIERVGCTNSDQNDLGSTLLPLQISTIYEVTWISASLHDSTWRKIREHGQWIPRAQQQVLTYNQVNAAH